MLSLITLLQGIGLAYAAGLNLYATVAVTGLAVRLGWVQHVGCDYNVVRVFRVAVDAAVSDSSPDPARFVGVIALTR